MDQELERIHQQLGAIRMERRRALMEHHRLSKEHKSYQSDMSKLIFSTLDKRRKAPFHPCYEEPLEQALGPVYPRKADEVLNAAVCCEALSHQLVLAVSDSRQLTDSLICEITVLEHERDQMVQNHLQKVTLILEEMNELQCNIERARNTPIVLPKYDDNDDDMTIVSSRSRCSMKSSGTYETYDLTLEDDDRSIFSSTGSVFSSCRNRTVAFGGPLIEEREMHYVDL